MTTPPRTVLVTGSTGYIGSRLVPRCREDRVGVAEFAAHSQPLRSLTG